MKNLVLLATLLCGLAGLTQNPDNNQKFYDSVARYFKADREKIHLHPAKTVFLNSETVWFKGYITELKTGLPYGHTTNVHVQLRDASGKAVQQVLVYAEGSIFTGFIQLSDKIRGGIYHIHAYTNYMNNFSEDESAIATISIIDEADGNFYNPAKPGAEIEISFFPEGGSIVDGIANTIGIRIRDCNGNGIAVQDATITDPSGKTITNFSTSASGHGRFEIPVASTHQYTANISRGGNIIKSKLPLAATDGVSLSANSYTNPQKTVIRLRTNTRGAKAGPYKLFLQQGPLASGSSIDLLAGERTIAIPTGDLPYGINSLFLTDGAGKLIASRMFYNLHPASAATIDFRIQQKRDSVIVAGLSSIRNGEISIAVLPVETIADQRMPDLASSVWADVFLNEGIGDISHLISDYSRKNGYELDNRLICNTPKYAWEKIIGPAPVEKHPFDIGLALKATINSALKDRASAKVTLQSYELGLNETRPVNTTNEVIFNNIMAVDSTRVHFSLFEKNDKPAKMQMAFGVNNTTRQFIKPFVARSCVGQQFDQMPLPNIAGAIELKDVLVEGAEKADAKLGNLTRYNNNWARGYKIGETQAKTYRDVLSFIQDHGYNVERDEGNVIIRSRVSRSFRGSMSPQVFMDDVPLTDFNILYGYSLEMVDEIYINRRGFGGGDGSSNGIIRIYTRRDLGAKQVADKVKSQGFLIERGFQNYREFEMPRYNSFNDPGFINLGILHWLPRIGTTETGNFAFALPQTGLNEVKLIIRGISSDGTPVSQTRILKLK